MELHNYQTILVGVDGSEQGQLAFEKAIEVARRNNGRVVVAHVIESRMYMMMGYSSLNDGLLQQEEASTQTLMKECQAYAQSVDFAAIVPVTAYGTAKDVMTIELPQQYQVDLIMVGQSGLNAVERFMTGSLSSYIVRHAPCDVLIVHPESTVE